MINDLDKTLEVLLRRELPPDLVKQVAISFAAPDNDFPPAGINLPAVDLFLYDIRENLELRNTEWIVDRGLDGTGVRRRAPVRIDCSYLITAWSESSSNRALDEHGLLSEGIRVLVRYPILPEAYLQGGLERQDPPLPSSSLQPGRLQSVAEFWTALGGRPKAAINYTVTIGLVDDQPADTVALVTDKNLTFSRINPETP